MELECYAGRSTAYGKISLMVSEYKGLSTSQTLTKPDAPTFSWRFVARDPASPYGQTPAQTASASRLHATLGSVLQSARDFVKERGRDP